ncbi:hypothetical protein HF086_017523 [Spodoptera exigua]|uniref:Uncharacterized protein n=1 Tax=Spodoptera exigua TaxID=7107 RepID=A0A922ME54_SPOEX|nr:hypothetical protein HF086_017523 [Spodoptera exigua]
MDTACLRIKFTPLLQKLKNNSKCCLEIVPEVSCLQNLDKLTWKKETNFIEYTIPMTYKVILKKRQDVKDRVSNNSLVKTYHSCVDLLISSSKSTVNLGSGDVTRIISDTFIFNKTFEGGLATEDLIKALKEGRISPDLFRNHPIAHKSTNTFVVDEIREEKVNKVVDKAVEITKLKSKSTIFKIISIDEITNTEDLQEIFVENKTSSNALANISVGTNSTEKIGSGKKLSLCPICSISTQEPPVINKIVTSKAVTCRFYDSPKDSLRLGSTSSPSDLSHDNQTSNAVSRSNAFTTSNAVSTCNDLCIDVSRPKLSKRLRFKCRIPPEIRIAEYMQTVEKEILPLKLMLSDIICKCSALGITFNKKPSEQSLVDKFVSTCTVSEIPTSKEITKSNRVVYSFVFEG